MTARDPRLADRPNANLAALIDARAASRGDAPCWMTRDRGEWSYSAVRRDVAGFARALRWLGVCPGDRVLVQVEKSPEALLVYLATLAAGAVFVPLNTAYTPAEVEYFARDSEPALLLVDPSRRTALEPVATAAGVARLETLDAQGGGSFLAAVRGGDATGDAGADIAFRDDDDLAAILYTSGTTGRSKGAMLTHRNLRANGEALVAAWGFDEHDVLLHALPVYHIHGLFVASHCSLLSGASAWLLPKFDVDDVLRTLPRSTVFMGVPTYYTRLLAEPAFGRDAARNTRLFVSGSAPLLPQTFADFEARTGQRILERYGMSEAGIIATNPLDGERVPGTVGFPLPGVEVRAAAESGVLEIRGPGVFKGYWRMPEKTASEFRDGGWFATGDLATLDASGRIAIVGRAKDLIISGGFNVYPKEIELEIDALPGVVESAVVGVPHPDFGEGVIAVVAKAKSAALDEVTVIDALRARLAAFKRPKRVLFVDDLPRNAMGKVQKNLLRDRYAGLFSGRA